MKIKENHTKKNMAIRNSELSLLSMIKFRVQMNSKLYQDLLKSVYKSEYITSQKNLLKEYSRNISNQNTPRDISKISIAQKNISKIILKI